VSWGALLLLDSEQNRDGSVFSYLLAEVDIYRVAGAVVLLVEEEKDPRELVFGAVAGLNIGAVRCGKTQEVYEVLRAVLLLVVVVVDQQISGRDIPFRDVVQGGHENAGIRGGDSHSLLAPIIICLEPYNNSIFSTNSQ